MKIRTGFISNSSSSSFIVGIGMHLLDDIKDMEKLKYMLCVEDWTEVNPYNEPGEGLPIDEAISILQNDLAEAKDATEEEIIELLSRSYTLQLYVADSNNLGLEDTREQHAARIAKIRKDSLELAKNYWNNYKKDNTKYFILDYADDEDACMEHGGLLEQGAGVSCIRISNH